MKTTKRMISILSLMLALVMCFSACGNKDTASNGDVNDASVTDNAQTDTTDTNSDNADATDSKNENTDASDKVDANNSKQTTNKDNNQNNNKNNNNQNTNNNQNKNSSKQQNTVQNSKSKVWADDYLSTMPEDVKKKGVRILMWREMHPTEEKMMEDFEKKTGCDVEVILTTEKDYLTKLVSLIGAGQSPDVVTVQSERFPGTIIRAMQPLNPTTFRLEDEIWNKQYMDCYKIGNYYFSVAIPGSWSCEDCVYVTYYQPTVLKNCGINTTPYELYKQGKWNWTTQYNMVTKVAGAGKGYTGISMQSWDLFMLSAGLDFVDYKDSQFVNNMQTPSTMLTKSWQEVCKLNATNLAQTWNPTRVLQGKVGLFSAIAYGIYNEGSWGFDKIEGGSGSIECVPLAGPEGQKAYTPYRAKTWGTPKGSKNQEGAAYFLRYWLDPSNCDMLSTAINKQAYEVYKIITSKNHTKKQIVTSGVLDLMSPGSYKSLCDQLYSASSNNVTTALDSQKGTIANAVNRANKDLARYKK